MELEGSLPHSQVPATCPCPEPARSSPYPSHPPSWIFIILLSSHLRLVLPSGLFPLGFPIKTLYMPLLSPIRTTCPTHHILLDFITRKIFGYLWLLVQLTYLLTYLLTVWSRVLLEKLTVPQLVKKFPTFYGTRKFITAFTGARHLSLSWASSVHNPTSHFLKIHFNIILPSTPGSPQWSLSLIKYKKT
jgi:hypothetical protein